MNIGLGDVKVAPNQGYQERVKDKIKKFVKELVSFVHVGNASLLPRICSASQPRDVDDLDRVLVSNRYMLSLRLAHLHVLADFV